MHNFQDPPFNITDEHLAHGLNADDYSNYAGQDITVIDLSHLPHWESMQHIPLSRQQAAERRNALKEKLEDKCADPPRTAEFYTRIKGPATFSSSAQTVLPDSTEPIGHFEKIIENPGFGLSLFGRMPFDPEESVAPLRAVYTEPHRIEAHKPTAEMITQGLSRSTNQIVFTAPTNNEIDRLDKGLHERRHLVHLTPYIFDNPDLIVFKTAFTLWKETDANLSSRHILRTNGVKDEILQHRLLTRYALLPAYGTTHWDTPAVDAIENGCTPPSFAESFNAIKTIKTAVLDIVSLPYGDAGLKEVITSPPPATLPNMLESHWDHVGTGVMMKNPGDFFNSVYQALKNGRFTEDRVAEHIAVKMLDAIDKFMPKMIEGTRVKQAKAFTPRAFPH